MKLAIKRLVAGIVRYAVRLALRRPWLKKRVRDLVTRMPRLHGLAMRVMFQTPAATQARIAPDQKNLSPHARRIHRALQQAIRNERR